MRNLMMTLLLILHVPAIFASGAAQIQSAVLITRGNPSPLTEADNCWTCHLSSAIRSEMPKRWSGEKLLHNVNDITDATQNLDPAVKCESFSSETDIGKWGNRILTEIQSGKYPHLMQGTPDLMKVCPAFASMQRRPDAANEIGQVYIVTVMSMSPGKFVQLPQAWSRSEWKINGPLAAAL